MSRALELISLVCEDDSEVVAVHIDNFLGKIKSLAAKYKVTIDTDLTKLRKDIMKGKLPDSVKLVMPLKESVPYHKRVAIFKDKFYASLKLFVSFLKTLKSRGKNIDIAKIIKPLAKLDIKVEEN